MFTAPCLGSCFPAALKQDLQAASQEKDAYLFLLFVLLKSCVLHPFYCCLHSAAGRAQLCTGLLLCPLQCWVRVGPMVAPVVVACFWVLI